MQTPLFRRFPSLLELCVSLRVVQDQLLQMRFLELFQLLHWTHRNDRFLDTFADVQRFMQLPLLDFLYRRVLSNNLSLLNFFRRVAIRLGVLLAQGVQQVVVNQTRLRRFREQILFGAIVSNRNTLRVC